MRLVATIDGKKRIFSLREGANIIGRADGCHICIGQKGISRQHAQCVVDGQQVSIRDLDSSNGVFLNGKEVREAILHDEDVIGLGKFDLVFEAGDGMDATVVEATPIVDDLGGGSDETRSDFSESGDKRVAEPQYVEDAPPSSDDTPVDQQFAPVKYEAQPVVAGPQLVQKDGLWFLKDPETGREVEIVPKWAAEEGVGPPDDYELAGAPAAGSGRPGMRKLLLAMAVFVVILLGFAAISKMKKGRQVQPQQPGYTKADYNQALDQGILLIDEGKMEDAIKVFSLAHNAMRDRYVAGIMIEICKKLVQHEEKPEKTEWDPLANLLREATKSVYSTTKVESFVNRKLEWIDTQQSNNATIAKAIRKLKQGDPEGAWKDFLKVPADHPARIDALPQITLAAEQCMGKYTSLARKAQIAFQWDEAITNYEKARSFSDKEDAYSSEISNCLQWKTDESSVQKAKDALEQDRLNMVASILSDVREESPFRKEADDILAKANEKKEANRNAGVLAKVQQLYDAGKGQEALDHATQENVTIDVRLSEKIHAVMDTLEKSNKAYLKEEFEVAQAGWQRLLQLEPNPQNSYHIQAKRGLDRFTRERGKIALSFEQKGTKALSEDQYQVARQCFAKARMFDPEGKLGKGGLDNLDRMTRDWWNKGTVAVTRDETDVAIAAFKKVLEVAEPGSFHYNDARKKLLKLGKQ